MGNKKKIREEMWKALFKWAVSVLLIIWTMYFCVVHATAIGIVSLILTLVSLLYSIGFLPKLNIKASKQEGNIQKDKKPRLCELWWNRNLKWFFSIIVFCIVVSLVFIIGEIKDTKEVLSNDVVLLPEPRDSLIVVDQGQQFDNLVAKFDYRMKQQLTYENAYQLLKDDYHVLLQMLQLLEENPKLTAASKYQYIDCFKNRADTAILIINKAIYDTTLTSLESHTMSEKFIPQVKEIEQMRNDL